jgi:hypothetical protein
MVVALHLEADGLALAEVDHACVLTGALQDASTRGGKPLEKERRVLVATVFGPEEREDRQLEVVRLPLEQLDDACQLAVREAEGPVQRNLGDGSGGKRLSGDPRQVSQSIREARRQRSRCEKT